VDVSDGRDFLLSVKSVTTLIKFAALPLMRPLRKVALELIEVVKGE
jgi:hypothetical protein